MTSLTKAALAMFDGDDGPQNERERTAFQAQTDFALAAREAGVTLSWREFTSCTVLEQQAWVHAGRKFRAQEAQRIALAQRGPEGFEFAAADTAGTGRGDAEIAKRFAQQIVEADRGGE